MIAARYFVITMIIVAVLVAVLSTSTSAGLLQLANDNGDFYQGSFAGRIQGDIDGAVFSPDPELFPLTVRSVEFGFHRPRSAGHISDSAEVRVQVYEVVDGVPGDLLAESEPQTFTGFDVWFSVPLEPPLSFNVPVSFMAAVKWEAGTDSQPAPSVATDSNLSAPQWLKDQKNLFHDANTVFGAPPCVDGFCTHSEFWGDPDLVGFNMIRVTVDTALAATDTPAAPTPTGTATATTSSTPTATATPTRTATAMPTGTATATATRTSTPTLAGTATQTPTGTVMVVPTGTPTLTATTTDTPTRTVTATATASRTATPTSTGTAPTGPAECRDVSGDGRVNITDLRLVAACWRDWSESCFQYDLVSDQTIDILDLMTLAAQYGCVAVTSTPTSTPTPTATATAPPPPPGRSSLIARVFLDYRCDRFFQNGVDTPLENIPVTISFPNGSGATRLTTSFGLVYFSGFDSSDGLTVSVDLSVGYRGRLLTNCFNSPRIIELAPRDFQSGSKTVQFGAEVLGEGAAP